MEYTGRIDIRARSLSSLVHGAGTSGNEQKMRTETVIQPDGRLARVPFLSGNSIKNRLRRSGAQYALDVMGVHELTKAEVDLIFSGGHLSKSGTAIDLEAARRLEALFPILGVCGYSAGNVIREGKVSVRDLKLVCAETAHLVPDDLRDHPQLTHRAGALAVEHFGTRHDTANKTIGRKYLAASEQARLAGERQAQLEASPSDGPPDRGDSAQMIYQFRGVATGAAWWGSIWVADLTDLEQAALASALHYAATDRRGDDLVIGLGAKNSVGFGETQVTLTGSLRVAPPTFAASSALTTSDDTAAKRYQDHLRERKDEIMAAIRGAVS